MALPVILDCDPGHDDAIALILALASPELKVLAVTTSAGNQTPDKTLNNALRILTLLGRDDIPVAAGAAKPLARELIIADNVLWSGKVLDDEKDEETQALHDYNQKILADDRVENILLPIRDGLMVSRKK